MKKLTSITVLERAEGLTVSYTFSKISDEGQITERNMRRSYVVMDKEELELINKLKEKVNLKVQAND